MKDKLIATAMVIFSLAGCETMRAHATLDNSTVANISKANAAVNYCLSKNAINKNLAYAFNSVSAQLLDITVIDRELYKTNYEQNLRNAEREAGNRNSLQVACTTLEQGLPDGIKKLSAFYMRTAQNISAGRAQDQQQMAAMLSNFGSNWTQPSYAVMYSWPKVIYTEERPATTNYLVNTSSGHVQCRVTNKNYVFCM